MKKKKDPANSALEQMCKCEV